MKITYALLYHVPKSRYFSFLEAKVSTKSSYTWRSILKTKNGKINDFTYLQCTYVHSELIVEETRWWEMDLMEAIFLPHEVGFIPKKPTLPLEKLIRMGNNSSTFTARSACKVAQAWREIRQTKHVKSWKFY